MLFWEWDLHCRNPCSPGPRNPDDGSHLLAETTYPAVWQPPLTLQPRARASPRDAALSWMVQQQPPASSWARECQCPAPGVKQQHLPWIPPLVRTASLGARLHAPAAANPCHRSQQTDPKPWAQVFAGMRLAPCACVASASREAFHCHKQAAQDPTCPNEHELGSSSWARLRMHGLQPFLAGYTTAVWDPAPAAKIASQAFAPPNEGTPWDAVPAQSCWVRLISGPTFSATVPSDQGYLAPSVPCPGQGASPEVPAAGVAAAAAASASAASAFAAASAAASSAQGSVPFGTLDASGVRP
mmetsp:Transcript_36148/g.84710  ORF Transcript_36148/g.84710 Transcript_36148/m.84710 type:complete len:299 (-) Transcript_36148:2307-3203(-)